MLYQLYLKEKIINNVKQTNGANMCNMFTAYSALWNQQDKNDSTIQNELDRHKRRNMEGWETYVKVYRMLIKAMCCWFLPVFKSTTRCWWMSEAQAPHPYSWGSVNYLLSGGTLVTYNKSLLSNPIYQDWF